MLSTLAFKRRLMPASPLVTRAQTSHDVSRAQTSHDEGLGDLIVIPEAVTLVITKYLPFQDLTSLVVSSKAICILTRVEQSNRVDAAIRGLFNRCAQVYHISQPAPHSRSSRCSCFDTAVYLQLSPPNKLTTRCKSSSEWFGPLSSSFNTNIFCATRALFGCEYEYQYERDKPPAWRPNQLESEYLIDRVDFYTRLDYYKRRELRAHRHQLYHRYQYPPISLGQVQTLTPVFRNFLNKYLPQLFRQPTFEGSLDRRKDQFAQIGDDCLRYILCFLEFFDIVSMTATCTSINTLCVTTPDYLVLRRTWWVYLRSDHLKDLISGKSSSGRTDSASLRHWGSWPLMNTLTHSPATHSPTSRPVRSFAQQRLRLARDHHNRQLGNPPASMEKVNMCFTEPALAKFRYLTFERSILARFQPLIRKIKPESFRLPSLTLPSYPDGSPCWFLYQGISFITNQITASLRGWVPPVTHNRPRSIDLPLAIFNALRNYLLQTSSSSVEEEHLLKIIHQSLFEAPIQEPCAGLPPNIVSQFRASLMRTLRHLPREPLSLTHKTGTQFPRVGSATFNGPTLTLLHDLILAIMDRVTDDKRSQTTALPPHTLIQLRKALSWILSQLPPKLSHLSIPNGQSVLNQLGSNYLCRILTYLEFEDATPILRTSKYFNEVATHYLPYLKMRCNRWLNKEIDTRVQAVLRNAENGPEDSESVSFNLEVWDSEVSVRETKLHKR